MINNPFVVGQKLYYVPNHKRRIHTPGPPGKDVTVTFVGRKWITIKWNEFGQTSRFNAETGSVDGGGYSSPGVVYLSQEHFERKRAAQEAWEKLCEAIRRMGYAGPKELSASQIIHAAQLLGIDIGGDSAKAAEPPPS